MKYNNCATKLSFVALGLLVTLSILPHPVLAQQGILPTAGETCADDACRRAICPQSPVARICAPDSHGEGKCITDGKPRGNPERETLPCNYTLDDLVLTGVNMSKFIFGITGSLMLLFMAYGGYQLFTSVGNPEGIMAGRKTLTAAFIGVILIFAATILVRFVAALILPHPPQAPLAPPPGAFIPEGPKGALPKIEFQE